MWGLGCAFRLFHLLMLEQSRVDLYTGPFRATSSKPEALSSEP